MEKLKPVKIIKAKIQPLPDGPNDVSWREFDEKTYVDKTRCNVGEDCYAKNKYNQLASDNLKSNRGVIDTRHTK